MIPNQILSVLLNVALFIIFVVAPIWVVMMHVMKVGSQPQDFVSRIKTVIVYTDEVETVKEIESGEIFLKLFIKALPSSKLNVSNEQILLIYFE